MKKSIKTALIILLILIVGIFIHPQKVIFEPKISGKVIDENGNPISDAIVSRIEELETINDKYGYFDYSEYKSQTTKTDKNGIDFNYYRYTGKLNKLDIKEVVLAYNCDSLRGVFCFS